MGRCFSDGHFYNAYIFKIASYCYVNKAFGIWCIIDCHGDFGRPKSKITGTVEWTVAKMKQHSSPAPVHRLVGSLPVYYF